jgi:hypothetical protein
MSGVEAELFDCRFEDPRALPTGLQFQKCPHLVTRATFDRGRIDRRVQTLSLAAGGVVLPKFLDVERAR